jgi:hypothetical protein
VCLVRTFQISKFCFFVGWGGTRIPSNHRRG